MKKNVKKFISSILALAMVVSMGLGSMIPATETRAASNDDTYTVTLADAENGKIEFNGQTDGKFKAGSNVCFSLKADEGYVPSSILITDADTGEEIIFKSSSDDLFSFTMPEANLNVYATFALEKSTGDMHTVSLIQSNGGTIAFNDSEASQERVLAGETVTINVTFDTESPAICTNIYTESGEWIDGYWISDEIFTFIMPEENVTISPEYYGVTSEWEDFLREREERQEALASVPQTLASDTGVYKNGTKISYAGYSTRYRTVDGDEAYCVNPSMKSPSNGTYAKHYNVSDYMSNSANYEYLRKALWVSYGSQGFDETYWPKEWYDGTSMSDSKYYVLAHVLLSYIYTGSDTQALYGTNSGFRSWCRAQVISGDDSTYSKIVSEVNAGDPAPESFSIFILSFGSAQDILSFDYKADVTLYKESADEDYTTDRQQYSLAGAVYYIYTDSACTTRAKDTDGNDCSLVTGTSGKSNSVTLDPGTYYIKENTPSPGFLLDTTVHQATVDGGTTKITSVEPLESGYATLLKVSANPEITEGNSCYSFEGAEFLLYSIDTVSVFQDENGDWRYYDGAGVKVENYTGLGTNQNGMLYLENGYVTFNYDQTYNGGEAGGWSISGSKVQKGAHLEASGATEILDDNSFSGKLFVGDERVIQLYSYNNYQYYSEASFVAVDGGHYSSTKTPSITTSVRTTAMKQYVEESLSLLGTCDVYLFASMNDLVVGGDYSYSTSDTLGIITLAKEVATYSAVFNGETVYPNVYIFNLALDEDAEVSESKRESVEAFNRLLTMQAADYTSHNDINVGNLITYFDDDDNSTAWSNGTLKNIWNSMVSDTPMDGITLTADAQGNTEIVQLAPGKYCIEETKAPEEGYYWDTNDGTATGVTNKHNITVTGDNTADNPATVTIADEPKTDPYTLEIQKLDAETGKTTPQGDGSMAGAEFTVKYYAGYYDETTLPSEATRTWIIATDADGYTALLSSYQTGGDNLYYDSDGIEVVLPYGTITIEETKAPEGYNLAGATMKLSTGETVTDGKCLVQINDDMVNQHAEIGNTSETSDIPIRGGVAVQKRDAQSLRDDPQGDGSFEGIEVTITNDSANSVIVEDEEYAPGQVVYTMYTDKDGYAETASDLLPYGHYILTETDVPSGMVGIDNDGYLEGNGSHDDAIVQSVTVIEFDIEEEGVIVNKTEEDDSLTDLVKRGDFYLEKHNEETQQPMSVPFRVTSETTGESHVFWTDMNGDYSSDSTWAKHTYKTDLGEDYTDGLWFYGYADEEESGVEVDDALGALPYDTYILDELPCEANEGMELVEGVKFTLYQDQREVDLGQYYNKTAPEAKFVTNASNPNLNDLQYVCADNHAVIKDSITYEGLDADATYTYVMKLWDNTVSDFIKDPETGEDLMLRQEMTPNGLTEGTFTMEMLFDATGLENHTVTVFQYLYSEDGELLLAEDDEANTDEQIYFPYLHTELTTEAGHHMALADGTITFADMVWYENFPENTEITIVGYLYYYDEDSEDHIGDVVIDANGNEVIGTRTFWNTSTSGEVEVDFMFDDSLLEGREIVASEHAFVNGVRIGYELDASDYAEMMLFPHLGTTALDSETEDHVSLADNAVTIVDHVTYDHVYPGKTLTLETTIMNAETGEALVDENGDAITVTQEFTPEESSGTIDVTFTFDASEYAGTTTVVFEYLYADDELVGKHTDLTDEGQTVYLPNVATQAIVDLTGTQDALALSTVDATDAVTYDHLMPNADYTLVSYIVDAETGDKLVDADGNAVTVITPIHTNDAGDGEVDVEFEFDASGLDGDTVVMTCYLYLGTEEAATDTSTTETTTDTDDSELGYVEGETESSITGGGEATLTFADGDADTETIDHDEIEPGIVETDGDGETVNPDEIEPGIVEPDDNNDGETVNPDEIEPGPVEEDPDSATTTNSDAMLVAVHDDLDDTDEWIVFHAPVIGTEALDDTTGTHYAYALEDEGITDTVHYEDLLEGQEYVMTGYPVDKETGEALTEPVSTEFTAESSEGDVKIHVDLDLSDYAGKEIVFYEELYYAEDEIAEHKDINDEDQTIIVLNPTIKTHAVDKDGNKNVTIGETTIVDTVDYEGLVAGQEYTMAGQIYDKETGEAIEGASGSVVFTAGEEKVIVSEDTDEETVNPDEIEPGPVEEETAADTDTEETETEASEDLVSGSVNVEVTLDTTAFADHDLVFFEELYVGREDIAEDSTPIAVHKDIDDEDQTVHVGGPKIHTMATDKNGNKEVEATVVELVDTVSYEGLKAGDEYTMVGEIYDKETGTAIAGTQTSVNFTAEASEGEMQVEVEFDATDYAGKDLVFFEKLYTKNDSNTPIASHEDINDADQTIHVKEAALVNLSSNAKTGLAVGVGLALVLALAGGVGILYYYRRKRQV